MVIEGGRVLHHQILSAQFGCRETCSPSNMGSLPGFVSNSTLCVPSVRKGKIILVGDALVWHGMVQMSAESQKINEVLKS